MDIGDRQLVGQIIDVLHALLHLGQLFLKQLYKRDSRAQRGDRGGEDRKRSRGTRKVESHENILNLKTHQIEINVQFV